jgi:hypothetical protein
MTQQQRPPKPLLRRSNPSTCRAGHTVTCPTATLAGGGRVPTFGPHGNDDVGGKGLALNDRPRAPQRDLDWHKVVADVGVRLWCRYISLISHDI